MRAALVATILLATLLTGCGTEPSPSPENVVSSAISGLSKGDEKKVCAQLHPSSCAASIISLGTRRKNDIATQTAKGMLNPA